MKHPSSADVALYASGDMSWWMWPVVRLHAARCVECRARLEAYRDDRARVRDLAWVSPPGVSWESLAAEMTANIRVGLEAGECVTPRSRRRSIPMGWRVAGVSAGFVGLLISAWWINLPASRTASLGRAMKAIARGTQRVGPRLDEAGPTVRITATGIELQDEAGTLAISGGAANEGTAGAGARPTSVTLSVQGSARAHYVDAETGQVTITSVYAQ